MPITQHSEAEAGWTGVHSRLWFIVRSSRADRSEVYLRSVSGLASNHLERVCHLACLQAESSVTERNWANYERSEEEEVVGTEPNPGLCYICNFPLYKLVRQKVIWVIEWALPLHLNLSSVFWMKWIWNWSSGRKQLWPFLNINGVTDGWLPSLSAALVQTTHRKS